MLSLTLRRLRVGVRLLNTSSTKVVATIGPASEQLPMLQQVVDAGLKIMRINFSHATYEEADLRTINLRKCLDSLTSKSTETNSSLRAIMLDTQGPEIRTGQFPSGSELQLKAGELLTLTSDDAYRQAQTSRKIWISYKDFPKSTHVGASVLIEDGILELKVTAVLSPTDVECVVMNNASLGNKKNVNLPGQTITLPAISDKDKADLTWGVKNDVDIIAASFIRKVDDVREIQHYLDLELAKYQPKGHPRPLIISKIESTEGLENFDSILEISDGIMVARGDLGVEIPQESLLMVQKEIIRKSNEKGKPVIVATQMLDSMQKNPRPTRAECTDVSNAVFDGADCVMLSGESAKGRYPVQSVATMKRIVDEAERYINGGPVSILPGRDRFERLPRNNRPTHSVPASNREALSASVADIAARESAACILVMCESGRTAMSISKFRPVSPVVCFTKNAKRARLLQVFFGLHPIVAGIGHLSGEQWLNSAVQTAKEIGLCKSGDKIVVVEGERRSEMLTSGTAVKVSKVV